MLLARSNVRFLVLICLLVSLFVESSDAWWRIKVNRRKSTSKYHSSSGCPNTHVVKLSDARDAATASDKIYYSTPEKSMLGNSGYKVIKTFELTKKKLKAIVAEKGKTRMVVFRGTNGGGQLMEQFGKAIENVIKYDNAYNISGHPVRVLSYVWDSTHALISKLLPYTTDPSYKYIITGHSLGGAMASLFSLLTKFEPSAKTWAHKDSCLITFGENRLGNKAFADLHDSEILPNRKARFVYCRDLVPHIPVTVYSVNGQQKHTFVHHSREIWLATTYLLDPSSWTDYWSFLWKPRTAGWRVCDNQDTLVCSNQINYSYLISDHAIKKYVDALDSKMLPTQIEDKEKKNRHSWEEAWKCSNK